jgi:Raf kinase inhibitor-like YbhB/YbcL family protein
MKRSSTRFLMTALLAVAVLGACDTGDGKTLKDTVVPTTVPPPDTTPLDSVAIDGESGGVVADSVPANAEGAPPIVPTEPATGEMELTAPWNDGAAIDGLYTCDGEDISPAFSWRAVPVGAVELALVVVDDDGSAAGDREFVHWVIAGFDPGAISLAEGEVPIAAIEATNSFGEVGWGGPCPPVGDGPHEYRFTLHALAQQVELGDGAPANEMMPYLDDLTIATAELTGTYAR